MPDDQKTRGVVVDFIGDEVVSMIFINSDEDGLVILPLDARPFEKWMAANGIGPGDLIGRKCEFDDSGEVSFFDSDDEPGG